MYKKSVVCIGKAIQSFSELELSHEVQSINAHCNEIAKITHLEGLHCLRHLDVSSNKLTVISGLQSLSNLCTLNLASNFLSSVSGLGNLHGLKRINLSYNNLTSLAGFTDLHGHGYLEIIQLHGNQLGDIQTILPYLQGLLSVKHLVLKLDDAENPICNCSDYRHKFFTGLPQLTSLDEVDKLERSVNVELSNLDSDFENLSCFLPEADEDPLVVHNEGVVTKSFPMHCAHSETEVKVPSQKLTKIANTMPEKENFASRASLLQINTNFHQKKNMKSQIASDKLAMKKEKINVLKKKKGRIKEKMHKKDITASTDVYCVDKETQLSLMKQLENETERRWKAEQASKKLADVVMRKQSEASNEKVLQNLASTAADRLKAAFIQEKEIKELLQNKLDFKEKEIHELKKRISFSLSKSSEYQQEMKKVNKQLKCLSTENNKIQEMHKMKSQEIQTELENTKRKHTFATNEVSHLQNRVKELEHLMVQKEEEHRNSIRGLVSYESAEFQCVLDCHLKEERLHQKSEIMQAKEKAKLMDKKYKNLENEFREALCIENHRFMQLRQENQALTEKMCNIESCLKETIEMESKSKSMIRDMTLIIKEQKIKLTETTSSKEECLQQYKKRIQDLELDCENSKRKTVQVEMLKQEKSSLLSQITAMQSVVDGLKEERRQWGRELAQQGSSLAQDRGRLNLKIESLEAEVQSLQKNNERDLNSLKIKSKIVDDQTETILKLKEALSIKDKEIKTKLDESLIEQQRLQQIIDNLHQETCFLNEENASLSLTVKQLKENLVDLNERHIELQDNHANLKVKWSDKVRVLGKLETQVKSVNEKMLLREQKLKEEKESALLTNKKLLQKLEDNYGIHQEQLQALKIAHDDETKRRQIDKDLEVGQLTKQVHDVENEMRMILEDSKKQKILYDGKLNKIKQTFEEMSLNT